MSTSMRATHTFTKLLSPSSHSFSLRPSASLLTRHQMSTEAENVIARLKNSGLLLSQGLIAGKWIDAHDRKTIKVCNPATSEVIVDVPCMGQKETNDAIPSAYESFYSWSKLTATERSKYLRKWYDLLIAHKEDLGQLFNLRARKTSERIPG
ncbi:succinate-semialdehyde dehydrogenase, mitochondrial-like isoform X2 [Quercus lobata]|uniref:succinate-semialdehyde dehydrogenase, mitochondrial-like isoform X2 n=1 Tax=Quercus lobata TaxID=97700 RepID=UPI0012485671|nr:succinate-semialdehyde dehydrogenase, mitochondrial-like isoform X2 [Quercus lobata]